MQVGLNLNAPRVNNCKKSNSPNFGKVNERFLKHIKQSHPAHRLQDCSAGFGYETPMKKFGITMQDIKDTVIAALKAKDTEPRARLHLGNVAKELKISA